jgi:Helix-turn-helix family
MTPEQAAHDTARVVVGTPARFMADAATFARGAELGFEGIDFYLAGRGGAMGDVPADVVAAALLFFTDDVIHTAWERSASVMSRRDAAAEWVSCGHAWARAHFADGPDYERLAELLGRAVHGAAVAGAPVFAGLRTLPEPVDAKALALHRLNALRELRGALHGAAVLTVGLTPLEAVVVRSPAVAGLFGWPEPHPDAAPFRDRWALAEARTDRMVGRHLAVLDAVEREELVELADAARAAVT